MVAVVGGVALLSKDGDPRHHGRSLSEWLEIAGQQNRGSEEARAAIRAIGSNAVPTLLKWMRCETPRWRRQLVLRAFPQSTWSSRPVTYLSGIAEGDKVYQAVNAFWILGTNAASAIPELMMLSRDTNHPNAAFYAINALSLLGAPAYPQMVAGLSDTNHPYRDVFARDFPILAEQIGTNLCQAPLATALPDPDPQVREAATNALLQLAPPLSTNAPYTH